MKSAFLNKGFIFCFLLILIQFAQIFYFQINDFLRPYDIAYWKDRYEHSQYKLPLSKRIIGDDGLYSYVGYQLTQGANPAGENAQAPPVGKYLIGLSILIFHNPAYYGLFIGVGSLIIFYFLSRILLQSNKGAILVSSLLLLDPLFFSQLWKAWLDIAQLFFLLLNLIIIISLDKFSYKNKILLIFISGMSLGLFAQAKTPILLPIIFILETLYFFLKGYIKKYPFFLFGVILSILFSYGEYFLLGNSIMDFLKLQKYIVSFWLQTKLDVHFDAIWQTLLFGKFPDISSGFPTNVSEWWIVWPIITVLGTYSCLRLIFSKKSSLVLKGIAIFVIGGLVIYTLIPSYPRYLLIILPFLYIFSFIMLRQLLSDKMKIIFFYGIILYGFYNATVFLSPDPNLLLQNFYYNFSHQYFQDVYQENIANSSLPIPNRQEFKVINQRLLWDATVKSITIEEKERNIPLFSNVGTVKIRVTYKTQDLGPFTEEKTINLVKENNQWKIRWDWDIALNKFSPGNYVEVNTQLGKRGTIFDHTGKILVQDKSGYLVLVNPEKINLKKEQEMLKFMQSYKYKVSDYFQNEYLENPLHDTYIPLFTFFKPMTDIEKNRLLSYSGVKLVDYPARIYVDMDPFSIKNVSHEECCTRIYSSYNYHGVKGFEKEYNSILAGYSGGAIVLKNPRGEIVRTIIDKKPKNGGNIVAY